MSEERFKRIFSQEGLKALREGDVVYGFSVVPEFNGYLFYCGVGSADPRRIFLRRDDSQDVPREKRDILRISADDSQLLPGSRGDIAVKLYESLEVERIPSHDPNHLKLSNMLGEVSL